MMSASAPAERSLLTTVYCLLPTAFSPFDTESRIPPRRIDADLFDLFDARRARPGGEVVFETLDALGRAFGEDFDATVREVADVSDDLMARGDALREEAKAHALNFSADEVMPRDLHVLSLDCHVRDAPAEKTGYPKRKLRGNAIGLLRQQLDDTHAARRHVQVEGVAVLAAHDF
jgi:hypothetical protein